MPIVPFIPAIIGGVGSIVGGKLASGQSKEQKQAESATSQLAQEQAQNAAQGRTLSTQYSNMATPALTNAMSYWQTLLTGDRTALASFLGPEIERFKQGNAAALANLSQFAPRGGGRTSTIGELPFSTAQTIGDMFSSVRPLAATNVGSLGQGTASLGLNALGQSTGAASGGAQDYLALLAAATNRRNNAFNAAAGIGKGLYTWAKGVDWGNVFSRNSNAGIDLSGAGGNPSSYSGGLVPPGFGGMS